MWHPSAERSGSLPSSIPPQAWPTDLTPVRETLRMALAFAFRSAGVSTADFCRAQDSAVSGGSPAAFAPHRKEGFAGVKGWLVVGWISF